MAKDPRFNFYPDNYLGGTLGFTLEQHGAYLMLIILQSKNGKFTAEQAKNHLASFTHGNTVVYTKLFNFLIPKFQTDGTYYWSERLEAEINKSKKHSELQSDRVKQRWKNKDNGITAVIPVNRNGIDNGINSKGNGGAGEKPLDGVWEIFEKSVLEPSENKNIFCKNNSQPDHRMTVEIYDTLALKFISKQKLLGTAGWLGTDETKRFMVNSILKNFNADSPKKFVKSNTGGATVKNIDLSDPLKK